MSTNHHLEEYVDYVSPWRKDCAQQIAPFVSNLLTKATAAIPGDADPNEAIHYDKLVSAVNTAVADFAAGELISTCVDWLTEKGRLQPTTANRIRSEVATGLRLQLPVFRPYLPGPNLSVSYGSWALSAVVGAVLGSLAFAPLTLLLFGQREAGIFVGGATGAGLTIGLVAWLSQRPKLLSALQKVAGTATVLAALAGIVKIVRQGSSGLLKGAGWIAGCWLLLLLAKPRLRPATRDQCSEALRPQIEQLLAHAVDLVLSLCWAHPDRVAQATSVPPPAITRGLVHSLGTLQAVFQDGSASEKVLHSAVRAVLQRVRAEGYEWQTVPSGTAYDDAFAERFECYDSILVGQQVDTLEPALVHRGELVKLGMLRSM